VNIAPIFFLNSRLSNVVKNAPIFLLNSKLSIHQSFGSNQPLLKGEKDEEEEKKFFYLIFKKMESDKNFIFITILSFSVVPIL
jgi:hypothetical protein